MRGLLILCALSAIVAVANASTHPSTCSSICAATSVHCTAACHLRPSHSSVCSAACQDGLQACLGTCTIGTRSAATATAATATAATVSSATGVSQVTLVGEPDDCVQPPAGYFCTVCVDNGGRCGAQDGCMTCTMSQAGEMEERILASLVTAVPVTLSSSSIRHRIHAAKKKRNHLPHLNSHHLSHAATGVTESETGMRLSRVPVKNFDSCFDECMEDGQNTATFCREQCSTPSRAATATGVAAATGAFRLPVKNDSQYCIDNCVENGEGDAAQCKLECAKMGPCQCVDGAHTYDCC